MLELKSVRAGYGSFQALFDVSLEVRRGEAVGVIGPNGAGKTTLMRVISGLIRPTSGTLVMEGADLAATPAHRIVELGVAHVPESRRLFPRMTVEDNLRMGGFVPSARPKFRRQLEVVYELFPRMRERRHQLAGSMSGGEQQMCAIGRGLMARPRILILDELSLGLAPIMLDVLVDALQRVHAEGTTVFVVEQDVAIAFDLATTGYVLENGRVVLSGTTADLRSNPHVKKAYLGL